MTSFNPLEDLGKKAQDLVIKKGFPSNIFKVSTETKTDSGIKIITESSSNQKYEILGAVKPEFDLDKNFKFKAELNTNHLGKIQVIASDLAVEGSKFDLSLTQQLDPTKDSATPVLRELEGKGIFRQDRFAVSVGASYQFEKKTPKFKGQLVLHYPDHVYWSVADEYSPIKGENKVSDFTVDGKVSYIQPTYEALANILYKNKEEKTTYSASWFQGIGSINYGVVFSTIFDNKGANVQNSVDVAGENKTDSGAILKGRVSTSVKPKSGSPSVRGAISLAQKVSSGFTFTVGADLNCRELFNVETESADSLSHLFGFEIKLND